jgi:hypothetical protein
LFEHLVAPGPVRAGGARRGAAPPAGSAKGQLTVDGKAVALEHAVAVVLPERSDETKQTFFVLLSDKPVPASVWEEVASSKDLPSVAWEVPHALLVEFGQDKTVHLKIHHPVFEEPESSSLMPDLASGQIETLGPDRVAGKVTTMRGKESEVFQWSEDKKATYKVFYDVAFEAPVVRRLTGR